MPVLDKYNVLQVIIYFEEDQFFSSIQFDHPSPQIGICIRIGEKNDLVFISCTKSPTTNCCSDIATKTEDSSAVSNVSPEKQISVQAQSFEECSGCIDNNESIKRYGIAVTDFNNDGDFEVVVTGYGAANQVWDWQDEKLVDIAPTSLQDSQRRAIGVAACDIDGDGQEEIYF